jgi:hypothetical protein
LKDLKLSNQLYQRAQIRRHQVANVVIHQEKINIMNAMQIAAALEEEAI